MEQMKNDPVNHPSHYTDGKYEVIDFIEDSGIFISFHLANAIKYICRSGKKNPETEIEDLKKACWYIHRFRKAHYEFRRSSNYSRNVIDPIDFIMDKGLLGLKGDAVLSIVQSDLEKAELTLLALIDALQFAGARA